MAVDDLPADFKAKHELIQASPICLHECNGNEYSVEWVRYARGQRLANTTAVLWQLTVVHKQAIEASRTPENVQDLEHWFSDENICYCQDFEQRIKDRKANINVLDFARYTMTRDKGVQSGYVDPSGGEQCCGRFCGRRCGRRGLR